MTTQDAPPIDMDALQAHLDRGWDLLTKKSDLTGAARSARQALEVAHDDPEALTLLGAIATAGGDDELALEHYRHAIEIDPEYPAPMLYAAEVLMGPADDPKEEARLHEEALKLVEQALDCAEAEDEFLDASLLHAEVLVLLGRKDEARTALDNLPEMDFPGVEYHLRAARSYLDLGALDNAQDQYERAIEMEPQEAEAYHGLGLVAEERDDLRSMVTAWLKVRELDLEEERPPWSLSQEDFEKIAEDALTELPEKIRKLLANVPILAADYPAIEIVSEGYDPRMMGFFSGVPYPEKSNAAGAVAHLDSVFLYQRNIERLCRNREETAKEIRTTVLHETGHFFGLDEDELEKMGLA